MSNRRACLVGCAQPQWRIRRWRQWALEHTVNGAPFVQASGVDRFLTWNQGCVPTPSWSLDLLVKLLCILPHQCSKVKQTNPEEGCDVIKEVQRRVAEGQWEDAAELLAFLTDAEVGRRSWCSLGSPHTVYAGPAISL